jgi:hypothetical protein
VRGDQCHARAGNVEADLERAAPTCASGLIFAGGTRRKGLRSGTASRSTSLSGLVGSARCFTGGASGATECGRRERAAERATRSTSRGPRRSFHPRGPLVQRAATRSATRSRSPCRATPISKLPSIRATASNILPIGFCGWSLAAMRPTTANIAMIAYRAPLSVLEKSCLTNESAASATMSV